MSVSTVRYFASCPCGHVEAGREVTFDVPPAEIEKAEQTHGHYCAAADTLVYAPAVLTVALYER